MDNADLELTAAMVSAEVRLNDILLMEIIDTMEARGLVNRYDIAAALLRMETRAGYADDADREEGNITHHTPLSKLKIDEWEQRFGLPPELHVLRKSQQSWIEGGSVGKSPLYPDRVIEEYSGNED